MKKIKEFYDGKKNHWIIEETDDLIIMHKNGKKKVFIINNRSGYRILKMKISQIQGGKK